MTVSKINHKSIQILMNALKELHYVLTFVTTQMVASIVVVLRLAINCEVITLLVKVSCKIYHIGSLCMVTFSTHNYRLLCGCVMVIYSKCIQCQRTAELSDFQEIMLSM